MTKPYVIGIDMGGTNTAFGIVDARGNVIASSSIKTRKHSKIEDYIDELHTEISRLIEANDAQDKIQGIGIGAPCRATLRWQTWAGDVHHPRREFG